ncbi:MAG: pilin [Candidatus Peregrinibacteria bacterium]
MSSLLIHLKKYASLPLLGVMLAVLLFTTLGDAFAASSIDPENLSAKIVQESDRPSEAIANTDIRQGLISVVNYFLAFLGLVAVAFIIYAGILMVIGEGEEDSLTKARKIIIYAVIGIVIIFLSWTIVNFVADIPTAVDSQGTAK